MQRARRRKGRPEYLWVPVGANDRAELFPTGGVFPCLSTQCGISRHRIHDRPLRLRQTAHQGNRARAVADLARCHEKPQQAVIGIRHRMLLGVQPVLRPPAGSKLCNASSGIRADSLERMAFAQHQSDQCALIPELAIVTITNIIFYK